MDLHPLVVHFPIALLVLWSVIEIVRPGRWLLQVSWGSVNAVLLIAGFLGALVALQTGEIAGEGKYGEIVRTHETFAQLATLLYGLFVVDLAIPFVLFVSKKFFPLVFTNVVTNIARIYERVFQIHGVRIVLALVALLAITVTGLLGGVMVFGPSADPLAPFVLSLLGIQL